MSQRSHLSNPPLKLNSVRNVQYRTAVLAQTNLLPLEEKVSEFCTNLSKIPVAKTTLLPTKFQGTIQDHKSQSLQTNNNKRNPFVLQRMLTGSSLIDTLILTAIVIILTRFFSSPSAQITETSKKDPETEKKQTEIPQKTLTKEKKQAEKIAQEITPTVANQINNTPIGREIQNISTGKQPEQLAQNVSFQKIVVSATSKSNINLGSSFPRIPMDTSTTSEQTTYSRKAYSFHEALLGIKKDQEIMKDFYVSVQIDDAIRKVKTFADACKLGLMTGKIKDKWNALLANINDDYFFGGLEKAVSKLKEKQKIQMPLISEKPERKKKEKGAKTEKSVRNKLKEADITAEYLFQSKTWEIGDVFQAYRSNWDNKKGCFSIKISIVGPDATKFVIHAHVIRQFHVTQKPWDIAASGGGGSVHVKKTGWSQIEGRDNEPHLRLNLGTVMGKINADMIQRGYNKLPNEDKNLESFQVL